MTMSSLTILALSFAVIAGGAVAAEGKTSQAQTQAGPQQIATETPEPTPLIVPAIQSTHEAARRN